MTAKEIFMSVVKGKNIITPNIIGYYKIKEGAVELSYGKGFTGSLLYGVTVVKKGEHNHELSECFNSEFKAREYIKSLKK